MHLRLGVGGNTKGRRDPRGGGVKERRGRDRHMPHCPREKSKCVRCNAAVVVCCCCVISHFSWGRKKESMW